MRTSRACNICTPPARGTGRRLAVCARHDQRAAAPRWSSSTSTSRRTPRVAAAAGRRGLQPDLVARRHAHRVLRDDQRASAISRCVRPGDGAGPPADRRCLRRPPAGLVAGRDGHRVHDRSLHHRSASLALRLVPHRRCSMSASAVIVRRRRSRASIISIRNGAATARCSSSAIPSGVPNVFRLDLAQRGPCRRSPTSATGVAGVTPVSPALSVAARHRRDCLQRVPQRRLRSAPLGPDGRAGAPVEPGGAARSRRRASVAAAEPTARSSRCRRCPSIATQPRGRPVLSPAAVARGHRVALPVGRRWTARQLRVRRRVVPVRRSARRSSAADRRSTSAARLDESAVGAMYVNRASRWNWGVTVEQTPDLRDPHDRRGLDPDARARRDAHARAAALDDAAASAGLRRIRCSRSRRASRCSGGIRQLGSRASCAPSRCRPDRAWWSTPKPGRSASGAVDRHRRGRSWR